MAGGKRGPAKQSATKSIRKDNPGKRLRKKQPAKVRPSKPSCPGWLSGEARAEWDHVVPQLAKLNLLCQLDQPSLAAYCVAVANVRSTSETIAKKGLTYRMPFVTGDDVRFIAFDLNFQDRRLLMIGNAVADRASASQLSPERSETCGRAGERPTLIAINAAV